MAFDPQIFAQTLNSRAEPTGSRGQCARYVRVALEVSGFGPFAHPIAAKRYGSTLRRLGFETVPKLGYQQALGDIVVIDAFTGHLYGHIAGWNGYAWVSDFVQRTLYPGPAYRRAKPPYVLYRYP